MEITLRDVRWSHLMRIVFGQWAVFPALCLSILIIDQLTNPVLARCEQRSILSAQSSADHNKGVESKGSAKAQKELPSSEPSTQEPKQAHPNTQTFKNDESKTKKENGEEGGEKGKEGTGRKAVSSLILTVKLALLGDPRLFPYEVEVELGSDEVTLTGKVSTEAEKIAAAEIASSVPGVKSVSNKLEVAKDLQDVIAHKQDDIITRHVKEQFAKSVTVTAANFDVKTEQGVVSLSGTVRFQVIVLEAVEATKQVLGVRAVKTDKVKIESEG
jgi:osmotically-inducible protein OsmY